MARLSANSSVRLAREAHDHVGRDGHPRHGGADAVEQGEISLRRVGAAHAAQGGGRAALEGEMEMAAEAAASAQRSRSRSSRSQGAIEVRRRRGTSVSARIARTRSASRAPSDRQAEIWTPVITISRYPRPSEVPDLRHHLRRRPAALRPAGERDDAEGAAHVAAVLHLDQGAGGAGRRRTSRGSARRDRSPGRPRGPARPGGPSRRWGRRGRPRRGARPPPASRSRSSRSARCAPAGRSAAPRPAALREPRAATWVTVQEFTTWRSASASEPTTSVPGGLEIPPQALDLRLVQLAAEVGEVDAHGGKIIPAEIHRLYDHSLRRGSAR